MRWLLLFFPVVVFADNLITIDQVGSANTITISQDGSHSATLAIGPDSAVTTSTFSIDQSGTGSHSASIEVPAGYNNSFSVTQSGSGNQTTGIVNFAGSANSVSVTQSGAGNHTFNLTGSGTNNANTVTATQSGGLGADKSFNLNMTNTNGAAVTVQQTNPLLPNSGSMSIQCSSLCGTYNYIRN